MNLYTDFYHILWFFMIYCFCGWVWESSFCSFKAKRLINRGFLMGPYIPIYGCGALLVYFTLYPYRDDLLIVYIGGVIFPTILEFLTSWIMEKLFAATWWDYSNEKFNIQGRICLKVSLFWGFFSVIMVEILHPLVLMLIDKIPRLAGQVMGGVFVLVFSVDIAHTVIATLNVKNTLAKMESVRKDIMNFLEIHKFSDEYRELSPSRMVSYLKDQWEERKVYLERVPLSGTINEYKEELVEKLSVLVKRYEDAKLKGKGVLQHHMKAYPKLKSTKYANSLDEMKKRLERLRKEL